MSTLTSPAPAGHARLWLRAGAVLATWTAASGSRALKGNIGDQQYALPVHREHRRFAEGRDLVPRVLGAATLER